MSYKEDLNKYKKFQSLNKHFHNLEKEIQILENKYLDNIEDYFLSLTSNNFNEKNEYVKKFSFNYNDIKYLNVKKYFIRYKEIWFVEICIGYNNSSKINNIEDLEFDIIVEIHKKFIKNRKEKLTKILKNVI